MDVHNRTLLRPWYPGYQVSRTNSVFKSASKFFKQNPKLGFPTNQIKSNNFSCKNIQMVLIKSKIKLNKHKSINWTNRNPFFLPNLHLLLVSFPHTYCVCLLHGQTSKKFATFIKQITALFLSPDAHPNSRSLTSIVHT